jgi:hypothetical protein
MNMPYPNNTVTAVVTKPQPAPIPGVVLNMPYEHAQVLIEILNSVGGDPSGPRGVADDILLALSAQEMDTSSWIASEKPPRLYKGRRCHSKGSIILS